MSSISEMPSAASAASTSAAPARKSGAASCAPVNPDTPFDISGVTLYLNLAAHAV